MTRSTPVKFCNFTFHHEIITGAVGKRIRCLLDYKDKKLDHCHESVRQVFDLQGRINRKGSLHSLNFSLRNIGSLEVEEEDWKRWKSRRKKNMKKINRRRTASYLLQMQNFVTLYRNLILIARVKKR